MKVTYESCQYVKDDAYHCHRQAKYSLDDKFYCRQHFRIVSELGSSNPMLEISFRLAYKRSYCGDCGHMRQYHAHGRCWICRDGEGERHEFSEKPTVLEGDNGS